MNNSESAFSINVEETKNRCPVGETTGQRNIDTKKIPVLSCEGACIRGEIARLAANMVAKNPSFARACHGELLTVPDSAMAKWVENSEKVVLIDGCFLRCHGRILESLITKEKLVQFDALNLYKKYTDLFDIDDVPEEDRKKAAREVADYVLSSLTK